MDIRPLLIILFIGFLPSLLTGQQNQKDQYIYRSGDLVIISDLERTEGIHYKIEVVRLDSINPNDPELERLKKYGEIYTEELDNLGYTSLLIGIFNKANKAKEVERKLKDLGFTNAKVLTYKNGLRQP